MRNKPIRFNDERFCCAAAKKHLLRDPIHIPAFLEKMDIGKMTTGVQRSPPGKLAFSDRNFFQGAPSKTRQSGKDRRLETVG